MRLLRLPLIFAFLWLWGTFAETAAGQAAPRLPGELAWTIGYDPKTLDPAKVDDQESEMVRFLTAGVLLRTNRLTQKVEPQLADSWQLSSDGRTVTFELRSGLKFSNGASLSAKDAAWSIRRVLSSATAAPAAQEFLAPDAVTISTPNEHTVIVHLSRRVIGIGRVFDEIAIEPFRNAATPPGSQSAQAHITSGPFVLAEYHRGQYLRLRRNPYYAGPKSGKPGLPLASGIRLDILDNREQEIRLFVRGEYDLIDHLPPDHFALLEKKSPASVRDMGASLNTEQMWFNQSTDARLPAWEKSWFTSRVFRVAISQAIRRQDLARIAYEGHATPAYSFISPVNSQWYNHGISLPPEDVSSAKSALAAAGFHSSAGVLYDSSGHPVRFSILINAGNPPRQMMASLIQQDLKVLGIEITVVALDFPALIERLMHTQDYEACLLGLENVNPDPDAMMNLWLSSSPNHQWNPSQKTPATPWEAEIDQDLAAEASSLNDEERKKAIDRVQQIVADQQPFLYLVYPNLLYAISPRLEGAEPSILAPGLVWNVEHLHLKGTP